MNPDVLFFLVPAEAGSGVYIDNALQGVDFSVILNEIVAAAPIFLPSLIAIIGFKKALRWVVGSVKGS